MRVPLQFSPVETSSADRSESSALLLGLALRHLREKLGLPASELLELLQHEVDSLNVPRIQRPAKQQLALVQQVLMAPNAEGPA